MESFPSTGCEWGIDMQGRHSPADPQARKKYCPFGHECALQEPASTPAAFVATCKPLGSPNLQLYETSRPPRAGTSPNHAPFLTIGPILGPAEPPIPTVYPSSGMRRINLF